MYKYAFQAAYFAPRLLAAASSPRAPRSTSLEKASAEASDPARRHPRGPPTRTHASSGEHKRAQQQKNDASQQTTPSISQAHPNARTAHPSHTTTPGRTHRGLVDGRPATDCSKPSCRKQSVCRRQSATKQAAPPSRGSPQPYRRWPTARSWRPRARPIKARRPSKHTRQWYRRRPRASSGSGPRSRKTT